MARGGSDPGGGPRRERPAGRGHLGPYQAKRDFSHTPEPAGAAAPPAANGPRRFVVQRHRARRVHYDLRFEIDGVLVSWAVPNGPTLDPAVKRLAVHVEDHPIEYLYFEGVIPRGQYGAGDVIVWDTGTWEPHGTDDPAAAVAAGDFHADVTGHKLRGRLVLVRRGGNGAGSEPVAAAAQGRRRRGQRLGSGGLPGVGAQRPDQRTGAGRPGPGLALGPATRAGVGRAAPTGRRGPHR